jgi:DNA primase
MSFNSYAIKALLDDDKIRIILENLGANGIYKDSNGLRSSCPIHHSKANTVFVYNIDKNLYCCYGECTYEEKDGDIFKLVQIIEKCNFDDAASLICEWTNIDKNLVQDSDEWLLEELKIKMDNLLMDSSPKIDIELEYPYGVEPISEDIGAQFIGQEDDEGFISSLGFSAPILTLFESGFDPQENRWLLPIRSPDGELLGFDGRDITNKSKSKWKKRSGLLKNKLLGRLDIVKEYITAEDKIILCEGKKDQMAIYEAELKHTSCLYGSTLSDEQKALIDNLVSDEIIICADGDNAGYKMVQSIVSKCYPEYNITCMEMDDGYDPADVTKCLLQKLYYERIPVEQFLKKYEYRAKKTKNKK